MSSQITYPVIFACGCVRTGCAQDPASRDRELAWAAARPCVSCQAGAPRPAPQPEPSVPDADLSLSIPTRLPVANARACAVAYFMRQQGVAASAIGTGVVEILNPEAARRNPVVGSFLAVYGTQRRATR